MAGPTADRHTRTTRNGDPQPRHPSTRNARAMLALLVVALILPALASTGGAQTLNPDLVVSRFEIWSNQHAHNILIEVHNQAGGDASFATDLVVELDPDIGFFGDSSPNITVPPLDPYEKWATFIFLDGWYSGTRNATTRLDVNRDLPSEASRSNNVQQWSRLYGRVDLVPVSLVSDDDRIVATEPTTWTATMGNLGDSPTYQIQHGVFFDGNEVAHRTWLGEMFPEDTGTTTVQQAFDAPGAYPWSLHVDPGGWVGETDETNNVLDTTLTVHEPAPLDKLASYVKVIQDQPQDTIDVIAMVKGDHPPRHVRATLLHNGTTIHTNQVIPPAHSGLYLYDADTDTYQQTVTLTFERPHHADPMNYSAIVEVEPERTWAAEWETTQVCTTTPAASVGGCAFSTSVPQEGPPSQDGDSGTGGGPGACCQGVPPQLRFAPSQPGLIPYVDADPPRVDDETTIRLNVDNPTDEAAFANVSFTISPSGSGIGGAPYTLTGSVLINAHSSASVATPWIPRLDGYTDITATLRHPKYGHVLAGAERSVTVEPPPPELEITSAQVVPYEQDPSWWFVVATVQSHNITPGLVELVILDDQALETRDLGIHPDNASRFNEMGAHKRQAFGFLARDPDAQDRPPHGVIIQARHADGATVSPPWTVGDERTVADDLPLPETSTADGVDASSRDLAAQTAPSESATDAPAIPLPRAMAQLREHAGALAATAAAGIATFLAGLTWINETRRLNFLDRVTKWARFLPALALFSRITKEQALDHKTRDQLHAAIKERPGIHYSGLLRTLEPSNGVLAHHLRTLQREGLVRTRTDGRRLRFFAEKAPSTQVATLINPKQQRLIDAIASQPGITQSLLAEMFGVTRQAVYEAVTPLRERGLVMAEQRGRKRALFLEASASRRIHRCTACNTAVDRGDAAFGHAVCPECGNTV